jgi:hypothetical protein
VERPVRTSGISLLMGEQAKANTTAGNAAFWRNSLNQIFMAEKGLGCYCFGFGGRVDFTRFR